MSNAVSVIIPNFNRASIIGETIENMLSQTLPPHEVIVVDDGSTDNSVEVIRSFGDRVTLIQQSNQGPGVARNAGLKIAAGEFIQLMDSDDLATANKLEVQSRIMADTKADIVYGPWMKAKIKKNTIRPIDVVLQGKPIPNTRTPMLWFLTNWSVVFQQMLVRKTLIDKSGGYRSDMWGFEDSEYFIRLLTLEPKIAHESQSLTLYRDNDFGKLTASGQKNAKRALNHADMFKAILDLSKTNPVLNKGILHTAFRYRVWITVQDLIRYGVADTNKYEELFFLASKLSKPAIAVHNLQKKVSSFKSRFTGHRWAKPYQTAPLSNYQKGLLENTGFTVDR